MPRTPLLGFLSRVARDHSLASAAEMEPAEFRERRAERLVSRRQVLAGAAAGAALAALPKFAAAASFRRARIAIVGGGMSGVTAALTLRDYGIPSTVFEASGRAGGRMFSNAKYWDDGQVSEWCGELIDTGHVAVRRLEKRFGIPLFNVHAGEPPGSTETFRFAGEYYPVAQADADFAAVRPAVEADVKAAGYPTTYRSNNAAGRALSSMSVFDWIETRVPGGHGSPFGRMLDVAYTTEYGADSKEQSALNLVYLLGFQPQPSGLALFGESDETSRIEGGNERLPKTIAQSLGDSVLLGWRMESIAQSAAGAYQLTFDTPEGARSLTADVVVLALPFAILRNLAFAKAGFDDRKRAAIRNLGRGVNGKLQMQFRSRVWTQPGPYPAPANGASYSDTGYQQSWDASRSQPGAAGLLNAYSAASVTAAMSATRPFSNAGGPGVDADVQRALGQLEQVFPGISAQWNGKATQSLPHRSPNFGLAYSYWKPGQYHTIAGYERARQGGVFFAGEHTSIDFQGFMEGAAAEGERAAHQIVRALRSL